MGKTTFAKAVSDTAAVLKTEVFSDHLLMAAAGLAFHAIVAVLPALAAVAAIFQLLGDSAILERGLNAARGFLPSAAVELAREFITSVPNDLGIGIGLIVNLGIILWTAQRAADGLISALNMAFDVKEERDRLQRALAALAVAIGGFGFMLFSLAALTAGLVVDTWLTDTPLRHLAYLRWPVLGLALLLGLGILYSFGPNRRLERWQPITWGSAIATILWMLVSFGFSLYVKHAGSFGQLYGSLSSVVVVLLWFYFSAFTVLFGAEVDAFHNSRLGRHAGSSEVRRGGPSG
jgi:membrane protein